MATVSLFVYGSLYEGMVHYDKIRDLIVSKKPAVTQGSVYRLQVGYPVLLKEGQDQIKGLLVEIEASDIILNFLDTFFGFNSQDPAKSINLREEITVLTDDSSETTRAYAYVANPAKLPKTASLIIGGDWMSSIQQKPVLTQNLSERQRSYIQKLGSSSGRDIVPIDLALYRELMNLEMIVDKGRRLALSKLGVEVYRHL